VLAPLAAVALLAPAGTDAAVLAKAPSASTGGTEQRTYSSATLLATVDPHGGETTYYFQYGTTAAYGAQTPTTSVGNGTSSTTVAQGISSLQAGVAYHYRVVAVSTAGTAAGRDRVFTTRSVSLRFELPRTARLAPFGSTISLSGTLSGTGAAGRQVQLQASQYPFLDGFVNLGGPVSTDTEGRFSFRVSGLSQNTQLRVSTFEPSPLRSGVVVVRVAPRVVLHSRATATPGLVRVYGTVSPALVGTPVAIQLLRNGGTRTIAVAVLARGNSRSARFSALVFVKHGLGGLYRAFVKGSGRYAAAASRGVVLHGAPAPVKGHKRGK
jgi:hypothetical protein